MTVNVGEEGASLFQRLHNYVILDASCVCFKHLSLHFSLWDELSQSHFFHPVTLLLIITWSTMYKTEPCWCSSLIFLLFCYMCVGVLERLAIDYRKDHHVRARHIFLCIVTLRSNTFPVWYTQIVVYKISPELLHLLIKIKCINLEKKHFTFVT